MTSIREELKSKAALLASENVFIGTSSWKYPGWCGQLYDEARYLTRSKFSKKKFDEQCLGEYAETFHTVCVDAGYYKFPDERYIEKLCSCVPDGFRFSFKVTDVITIKHFPNLPRFGSHAGRDNEHFLNAEMFSNNFLRPCEQFSDHIGAFIFEFSQFHSRDFERGRDFVEAMDNFLTRLPQGRQYAVEIRNQNFLKPEYFEMLSRHGVAHVFNSWSRMPPVKEQIAMNGSQTAAFLIARFLLTPGRNYEQAVKDFSPYTETKARDDNAREGGRELIQKARGSKRPSFIYVNNRLEGNALSTIDAMVK